MTSTKNNNTPTYVFKDKGQANSLFSAMHLNLARLLLDTVRVKMSNHLRLQYAVSVVFCLSGLLMTKRLAGNMQTPHYHILTPLRLSTDSATLAKGEKSRQILYHQRLLLLDLRLIFAWLQKMGSVFG